MNHQSAAVTPRTLAFRRIDGGDECPDGTRRRRRHRRLDIHRVLLRHNIAIDAETAQLVATAVQAALQARPSSRRRQRAAVLIPYGGSVVKCLA